MLKVVLSAAMLAVQASTLSIEVHADAPGNDHENLNGEYAIVRNAAESPVAIGAWTLCDAAEHCFVFPPNAEVPAEGEVRVYTGSGEPTPTAFYMASGRAVWNNTGDTATLANEAGEVVVTHSY